MQITESRCDTPPAPAIAASAAAFTCTTESDVAPRPPAELLGQGSSDGFTTASVPVDVELCTAAINPPAVYKVLRFKACATDVRQVQVRSTSFPFNIIGSATYQYISYIYSSPTLAEWGHQVSIFRIGPPVGAGASLSVGGQAACVLMCQRLSTTFPPQPLSQTDAAEGEAFFRGTSVAPGQFGIGKTGWGWSFSGPNIIPSIPFTIDSPDMRCDNVSIDYSVPGCVHPAYSPVMVTSQATTTFPAVAQHILDAQASGLPGAYPSGAPLNRLTDPGLRDQNGNTACPQAANGGPPRPTGFSCDEYPFRSAIQGAFTGSAGQNGRTFPQCQVFPYRPLGGPGGVSGYPGYSLCMVPVGENSAHGNALGQFYRENRVLFLDAYRVWITP